MENEEEWVPETLPHIPFQRRKRTDSFKKTSMKSPVNLDAKAAIEMDLGVPTYDNMWKTCVYTYITNTGRTVKLEQTAPGSFKWKPVGEIAYQFREVEFYWSDLGGGSCHAINHKKFDMELVFSFIFQYDITVPSDLIYQRVDLHHKYRKLKAAPENDDLLIEIEELEQYYDDLEDFIMDERYTHSEAREALSHRKPTDYNIIMLPQNLTNDSDDVIGGGSNQESSDEESNAAETPSFDRQIRFKKEKEAHELAGLRFYSIFAERMAKGLATEPDDIEALLNPSLLLLGNRDQADTVGREGGDANGKQLTTPKALKLSQDTQQSSQAAIEDEREAAEAVEDEEEEVFDPVLFPTERDRARERVRRAKFKEERDKRQSSELVRKMDWIKKHQMSIRVNVSIMFEENENAPHYNLFSYLSQVKEPNSKVLVDGNLLLPFKEALSSPDYFTYTGSCINSAEEVVWVVMKNPLPLVPEQLSRGLGSLKDNRGNPLVSMSDPIQNSSGRPVYMNVLKQKEKEVITCPGKHLCTCEMEPQKTWESYKQI